MIGTITRRATLAFALLLPIGTGAVGTASAQSACGPQIRIAPGDTLARIARNCGVPAPVLRRANPQINWNILRIGAVVNIPGGSARTRPRPPEGVYVIQRGDTLRSVAAALGVSLPVLLQANPGLTARDLVPGRLIRLGDRRGGPQRPRFDDIEISAEDDTVEAGGAMTVLVEGLPPRVPVIVHAGPEGARNLVQTRGRSGPKGRAIIEIDIPDTARPGERWIVEALDPDGRPVARDRFRIASRERRGVKVVGLLTREGIECPALRSDDGDLYTLTGRLQGFRPGDVVTVTGRIAEASICQQGTTIEIEGIEEGR